MKLGHSRMNRYGMSNVILTSFLVIILLCASMQSHAIKTTTSYRKSDDRRKIDSLKNELKRISVPDTSTFIIYDHLSLLYRHINVDSSLLFAEIGLTLSVRENFRKGEARSYGLMGHLYYSQGKMDSAFKYQRLSAKTYEEINEPSWAAVAYENSGRALLKLGEGIRAIDELEYGLKLAQINGGVIVPHIMWWLGRAYSDNGYTEKGLLILNKAASIAKESEHLDTYISIQISLALRLFRSGDYFQAIDIYENSLDGYIEMNDSVGIGLCYYNIGSAYCELGIYDLGLEYLIKTSVFYQSVDYEKGMSDVFQAIGSVYVINEDHQNGLVYLNRSLKLSEKYGDQLSITSIKLDIASVYLETDDYTIVPLIISEVDSVLKKLQMPKLIATSLLMKAGLASKRKNYNQALTYYNNALKMQSEHQLESHLFGSYFYRAKLWEEMKNFQNSEKDYLRALNTAHKINAYGDEQKVLLRLSKLYEKTGDFNRAYSFQNRFLNMRDSIMSFAKQKQVIEMQTRFETELKEIENQKITAENEVLKKDKKISVYQKYGLVIGTIFVSLIFILILFNQKNKRKVLESNLRASHLEKKQLENKVQLNKSQLKSITSKMYQKNELLESLETEIVFLKNQNPGQENTISNLETLIQDNLKLGENLDDFAHYFNLVYTNFFDRLKNDHIDLTQNELRLCALQILNLGDKEISKILYISPDSVKKARYRLRKKLQLPEGSELKGVLNEYT